MSSKFYTNFCLHRNKVHVRGYDEQGEQFFEEKKYSPILFTEDHNNPESDFKSLDGIPLKHTTFDSPKDMRDFVNRYKDVDNFNIYGFPRVQYTAIAEWYTGVIKYNPDLVRSFFFDIEVDGEIGTFPEPISAKYPINAIAVVYDGKCICFGVGDFDTTKMTEEYVLPIIFKKYEDEEGLLRAFVNFWDYVKPDIVCGYNSESFDIPYLVNRIMNTLGEDMVKRLSPYGVVRERRFEDRFFKEAITFDIEGVATLDYLLLYQKHTFVTRESYKLDHIAHVELKERKIEYEGNLFDLYRNDEQLFFEYNCKDAMLVYRLDVKLGLLKLVMSMAYFAKVTYNDTFGPVKTWDVIIASRLLDEGVVVPHSPPRKSVVPYEGAYVKEPIPGRYDWLLSVDLNSEYPMVIRTCNIGPDTYIKPEQLPAELRQLRNEVSIGGVELLLQRNVDLSVLKKYDVSMAANGEFYRKDKEGILSRLVNELYSGRKADKNASLIAKSEAEKIKQILKERGVDV